MTKVYRIQFFIADNMVRIPTEQLVDGKFVAGGAEQLALGESLIFNERNTRVIMVPVKNDGLPFITRIDDRMFPCEDLNTKVRRKVNIMSMRMGDHTETPLVPSVIDGVPTLALQLSFIEGRMVHTTAPRTRSGRAHLAYTAREAYAMGMGHRIEVGDIVVFFKEYNPRLSCNQEYRLFDTPENRAAPLMGPIVRAVKDFYGDLDTFKSVVNLSWNDAQDYGL